MSIPRRNLLGILLTFVTGIALLLIATLQTSSAQSEEEDSTYEYVGLPESYFVSADTINEWIEAEDIESMRAHAWNLWSGLTADTPYVNSNGVVIPVWDTWYTPYDVFTVGPNAADDIGSAHEFNDFAQLSGVHTGASTSNVDLLGFNKFNQQYADHIWENNYYTADGLLDVMNSCEPDTICAIQPFTNDAVSMKPVFIPISSSGITIVPVWRGVFPINTSEDPSTSWLDYSTAGVGSSTWLQCVAIDMTGTYAPGTVIDNITSTTDTTDQLLVSCNQATVVSVDDFYHIPVTANDLNFNGQPNQTINQLNMDTLRVESKAVADGDEAIFVASHVTTREIPNWVWFTVWWSPNPNTGTQIAIEYPTTQDAIADGAMYDNYPGGGEDRPADIAAPWNNYTICTNYQYVSPLQGDDAPRNPDLTPEFCFNPYLEAGFSQNDVGPMGGINTNCMACHGNANWNGHNITPSLGYTSAMYIPRNDPQFDGLLQLDFAWSISGNVNPPTPEATEAP